MWHDNKYMRSGWFLDSIDVVDNKEQHTYTFTCGRWLAKNEDDGSLMRELVCTTGEVPATNHPMGKCENILGRNQLDLPGGTSMKCLGRNSF